MSTPKPIVIEIEACALRNLLTPVLPFAAKTPELPVLTHLHIKGHGDSLTATATNRYILGIQRADVKVSKRLDAILPMDAAKEILRIFKPRRSLPPVELRLSFTEKNLTVTGPSALDLPTVTWGLYDGKYPGVQKVITDALTLTAEAHSPMLRTADLRVLSAIPGPLTMIQTAPKKAVVVRNDHGFIGAVMPMNIYPEAEQPEPRDLTEWAGVLDVKTEAAS